MGKQVFVGNIAWGATDDDLRAAFEAQNLPVTDVRVMVDDETGRSRGFGFVTLAETSDPETAIERMHGVEVMGRSIRVDHAKEFKPRQSR